MAITDVSIGSPRDTSTWTVHPSTLQGAAQPTIDAFVPDAPEHVAAEKDSALDSQQALRALAEATFELKTNTWTKAQFLARVKAIYRALP